MGSACFSSIQIAVIFLPFQAPFSRLFCIPEEFVPQLLLWKPWGAACSCRSKCFPLPHFSLVEHPSLWPVVSLFWTVAAVSTQVCEKADLSCSQGCSGDWLSAWLEPPASICPLGTKAQLLCIALSAWSLSYGFGEEGGEVSLPVLWIKQNSGLLADSNLQAVSCDAVRTGKCSEVFFLFSFLL